MSNSNRTIERATAFAAALAECANVGKACAAVGLSRSAAYVWREDDPEFAAAWDRAMSIGVTALEDEAVRRGHEGVDEPVIYQGQFVPLVEQQFHKNGKPKLDRITKQPVVRAVLDESGRPRHATVKKYSDTLLVKLLAAHSEKYRDNGKSELKLSGSLELQHLGDDELNEEIDRLKQELAVKSASLVQNDPLPLEQKTENCADDGSDS